MTRIIAYTYETDVHCPDCTVERWGRQGFHIDWQQHMRLVPLGPVTDEHGLPMCLRDRDGNLVLPVFDTDEQFGETRCADCGAIVSTGEPA